MLLFRSEASTDESGGVLPAGGRLRDRGAQPFEVSSITTVTNERGEYRVTPGHRNRTRRTVAAAEGGLAIETNV